MREVESPPLPGVEDGGFGTTTAEGIVVPPELAGTSALSLRGTRFLRAALPPIITFVILMAAWEYGTKLLNIPTYSLPAPDKIISTLPTIGELPQDAYYTSVQEALPGFIAGSALGFLMAVIAMRSRFVARGVIPYAVVSNSMPIIGLAPISVAIFGDAWQSKAVIVAILTFFPMLINAYRGLTSIDPLSLQLMRSYAAGGWANFIKLRFPASLPYVFNALKINTTLAMIGAIVGEYFGGPSEGLGYYIHNEAGELAMPEVWSAVVVACAIGIGVYLLVVVLERLFTSWHISYRSGQ